jgi:hypothetical protein
MSDYINSNNKQIAQIRGYNVIPGDNGGFAYAKVDGIADQFPEWHEGFETEADAWKAAFEESNPKS